MDKITIQLSNPISAHGQQVTELQLDRPKVKHLKAMDRVEGQIGKTAVLIEKLANIPASSVDEISTHDLVKIGEALSDFLPGSLQTGEM